MRKNIIISFLIVLISLPAMAYQDMKNVKIEITNVNENVYMLKGAGGNIGVLIGDDGVFMIDDQFAALSEKIKSAIATISKEPIKFLVNTHHHGDHSGGNAKFKEDGTLIMAHENVRNRIKESDSTDGRLPILTFSDKMNLHVNNNDVIAVHVHNAHTDGDVLIYFPQSNVLHTGDTFFNGMFPYIDLNSGGSIEGDIEAAETGLSMINENTRIIPGHGEISNYTNYEAYLKMLKTIRENVQRSIDKGNSEAEIIKDENLTKEFYSDEESKNFFITGEKFRTTVYKSLPKLEN